MKPHYSPGAQEDFTNYQSSKFVTEKRNKLSGLEARRGAAGEPGFPASMKYLVIVESPSKCQKIAKYLNDNDDINIYEVVATMGHITELKSLENIDIKNGFKCKYDLVESKKKNTDAIRKKIKTVDEVILACDDDREGMGINFSVCQTFNLDVEKTKRIVFNEIIMMLQVDSNG